jgi:hypothetical protein
VRIGRFPGVIYLAPEPAVPFVRLTGLIQRRWPSSAPYEGAYDRVVPHVTVTLGDLSAEPATLEQQLPITVQAEEMWLMKPIRHGWRTHSRSRFGSTGPQFPHRHDVGAGSQA